MNCKFCEYNDVTKIKSNTLMPSIEGRKCHLMSQWDECYCRNCHNLWIENWIGTDKYGKQYKIFKVHEILQLKPGTCFRHITLGPCILMKDKNGKAVMQFKIKEYPATSIEFDVHPWILPMRILTEV